MPPCPTTRLHGAQWCHVRRLGRHDNGRTAPAFGSAAVARGHAKRRRADPELPALTELDYVLAVDDFSRVDALRLRAADGSWYRTVAKGRRITLPLIEREHMYRASRAVECGREPAEDLRYLQGKGTSLGGMRPKCTMVDEDGWQAIGKFPSVGDHPRRYARRGAGPEASCSGGHRCRPRGHRLAGRRGKRGAGSGHPPVRPRQRRRPHPLPVGRIAAAGLARTGS